MLSVLHGGIEERQELNAINNVEAYFDNNYLDEWFEDNFVKEMVLKIDKTVVISPHLMQSPILGPIPPSRLSGGVKALICYFKEDDFITDLTRMGSNCTDFLIEIARRKKITSTNSGYAFNFMKADNSFWGKEPKVLCLNDMEYIESQREWIDKMSLFVK